MEHYSEAENFFGLHFHYRGSEESKPPHILPARNLIQALEGLQRTIHLVAMMHEQREIKSRVRVTQDIEDRFQLHCHIAQPGSYYQPTFVADHNPGLFASEQLKEVTETTRRLMESIHRHEENEFKDIIPDSAYRAPIIGSLETLFRQQNGKYSLDIEDKDGRKLIESSTATEMLDSLRQSRLSSRTHSVVTGYFNRVDFKERKLSLLLPSGRTISCIYEEDVEADLLKSARDLIQVVGTIELDAHGKPVRITDVQEVQAVDTSSIDILELLPANLKSASLNNMQVEVCLSEDKQTYFATVEELGIDHAAHTRADLIEGLKAELDFLWKNIAQVDDNELARKARSLKEVLLRNFKEIAP